LTLKQKIPKISEGAGMSMPLASILGGADGDDDDGLAPNLAMLRGVLAAHAQQGGPGK